MAGSGFMSRSYNANEVFSIGKLINLYGTMSYINLYSPLSCQYMLLCEVAADKSFKNKLTIKSGLYARMDPNNGSRNGLYASIGWPVLKYGLLQLRGDAFSVNAPYAETASHPYFSTNCTLFLHW
jgi:hypothetical protein